MRGDISTVIHFSTAALVHSYAVADQHINRNHPQPYAQDVSLGGPGAGVIGACSHAGPGPLWNAGRHLSVHTLTGRPLASGPSRRRLVATRPRKPRSSSWGHQVRCGAPRRWRAVKASPKSLIASRRRCRRRGRVPCRGRARRLPGLVRTRTASSSLAPCRATADDRTGRLQACSRTGKQTSKRSCPDQLL